MDGMQLPYQASCFRSQVLDRVTPNLTDSGTVAGTGISDDTGNVVSDGSSTDMLLIDFR
jgi:hypothetical protein